MEKQTARIMIIDPDNLYIDVLARTFDYYTRELNPSCIIIVDAAHNASEALNLIDSGVMHNFIVSALDLPDKNGFELISELKGRNNPAITIANSTKPQYKDRCIDSGFDHFQTKFDGVENLFDLVCTAFV